MTVLIVGAGQAGARTAMALRSRKYRGRIVLIGEEPHYPYERPQLSKAVLLEQDGVAAATRPFDTSAYGDCSVEVLRGVRAQTIHRGAKALELSNGSTIGYEYLVLATGLRARPLRGFPDLGEQLLQLRTLDDAARLKKALRPGARVLVMGGGLLGLEIAATARQAQSAVTVIERQPALLYQTVAPVVGDYVMGLHDSNGVQVLTGVSLQSMQFVESPENESDVLGLHSKPISIALSNGQSMIVDLVIAATGSIVNTELAEGCGLEVQDGIVVDEYGRTSDPSIFAVGDVSRHFNPLLGRLIRVESWHNAENQPMAIASTIAGTPTPYAEIPWFWSDQYSMNLQIIGYSSDWDRVIMRPSPDPDRFSVFYLQGNRLVAANAINNGRDIRIARKWILHRHTLELDRLVDPAIELEDCAISELPPVARAG